MWSLLLLQKACLTKNKEATANWVVLLILLKYIVTKCYASKQLDA